MPGALKVYVARGATNIPRLRPRPRPRPRGRPRIRPRPRPRPSPRIRPRPRPRIRPRPRPRIRPRPRRKRYMYVGVYRPPPSRILRRPIITFRSKVNIRRRCEKIARTGNYRAFALRYGRQCYVARLTSTKFTRYGRWRLMRPGALQVYVSTTAGKPIRPRPRPRPRPRLPGRRSAPRYIGRYRTPRRLGRAVRIFRRRSSTLRECYRLARARRARAFAIRAGVSCYLSKMTSVKFTRRGRTRVGGLKVYVIRKGTSRPRPRPRPSRRIWNYRRLGTYKVPRGRSSPGRRYLGTVRPKLNSAKQCAIMARKARYRYFGVRSRRYCYGANLRSPLTRFGKTFSVRGMVVYKIGRGPLRPRPKTKVWHYRYVGRYKSPTSTRLGRFIGRMRGKRKVFECARRAKRMGYRAFALRNRGDCYVSRYSSTYSTKPRVFGRFMASTGGSRVIDAYVIRKGRFKPRPRPRKGGFAWHYRWLGRFRSLKGRGLGTRLGRVTGRKKVYSCALLAERRGYKAFALRRNGICYGTRSSRAYITRPIIKGRFRAGAGGSRFIDAYMIGKGHYRRPLRKGVKGRSRKARQRKRMKQIRATRRRVRRVKRKQRRVARTRKLKLRIIKRIRRLRVLRRKAVRVVVRVRRLKQLGNIKRLKVARKAKKVLVKRMQKIKRKIKRRRLSLKLRLVRLKAARQRARIQRARRRAMRSLRLRMKQRMRRLKLIAQQRRARALQMAKLKLQRRYRQLAMLRARQRAQAPRMRLLIRQRMLQIKRKIALRQRILRSRYLRRRQRASRLRLQAFRVKARQRRARAQLSVIRKQLISVAKRMVYYKRNRQYKYLGIMRAQRRQLMKRASNARVHWFRYQKQLKENKRRQRMLVLRQQRANKSFMLFQRKKRLLFVQQQQKLRKLLQKMKSTRRVRVGKKRGGILKKKPLTTNLKNSKVKEANAVPKDFRSADLFWSFEDASGTYISHDAVQKRPARLMGGSRVVSGTRRGLVADTGKARGWISLGDFTGKCFSDPDHCRNHGITMMASLKLDKKYFHKKSSSYFLSSGGQTTQARGFALLHILNRYILILSTKDNQWKLETRDLPDGWFNIAFSWEKKGLLKLYINGEEVARGEAMGVSSPKDSFSTLQVGRPNNSHSPKFRVPLEIDNIALWEKALTSKEIGTLADKDLKKTSKRKEKRD
ncbi:hypothetical protein AWC38_SpisGene5540 [Stylophora pistillata]|uniref:LamG-like jellyroll fold domain-containing protein n=1 Tax=Stylophora pistillata TaxID=50429 RepID=A0A2B4SMG4_STYPI|nr:hypothetical protein AWC38_SpisGene5540 [Stylophora pistillata]